MATSDDRVPGPDHRALNPNDPVVMDEATGTPPFIPAGVRTAVYVTMLVVDVLSVLVLGILPILGVVDHGVSGQIAAVIVLALNMLNAGLSVGYRPTRPGSPVAP